MKSASAPCCILRLALVSAALPDASFERYGRYVSHLRNIPSSDKGGCSSMVKVNHADSYMRLMTITKAEMRPTCIQLDVSGVVRMAKAISTMRCLQLALERCLGGW